MKKKLIYITLTIAVLCATGLIICNQVIKKNASSKLYTEVNDIPVNHTGLLLGTTPKLKNGNNNLYFDYRILAAVELYKAGKIKHILISGDNRKKNYNEPEEMKKALMQKGVPEKAIYLDYAGFRTLDSVVRAKEVFGLDQFTIISQQFHNERAIYLAEENGINAIGYNAKNVKAYAGLKTNIRELFARVKMFIDLAVGKQPRFLGEKNIIEKKKLIQLPL
ncbi:ElyC/SanA/YdcF family protein [Bacteroides sp.]|uniref:SanA/YdcF family protein n=1 Tax=Bacteroides sp. TaxID=29523 RepID=UPI00262DA878|nr:ElyC/SanA/YdcF family protein [Bacteroides sp.]MDD3037255.1 ElyC/SanA/YdcF family protein [Bacteroides sp.]